MSGLSWVRKGAVSYLLLALAWSALGFAFPERLPYLPEYSGFFLVIEIGGHALFGLAAGLATRNRGLVLLVTAESVLIDFDHLASMFVLPVLDRTAHSIPFIILSSGVLAYLLRRYLPPAAVVSATVASWFAHLAYDTFLNNGNFPLLFPFSAANNYFPVPWAAAFEASAVVLGLCAGLILERGHRKSRTLGMRSTEDLGRVEPSAG